MDTWLVVLLALLFYGGQSKDVCDQPLGLANPQKIKNEAFAASSVYRNDFMHYGPHKARLNSSGGYRAGDEIFSWILVVLPTEMVVTAIATQGYNDSGIGEWVIKYQISYKDQDMNALTIPKIFSGNTDSHSINKIKFHNPFLAKEIILSNVDAHNNFALRMELYGCQPGYYVNIFLLDYSSFFKLSFLILDSKLANNIKEDLTDLVKKEFRNIYGYLRSTFVRFSPQEYSLTGDVHVGVEFKVECLESNVTSLIDNIKEIFASNGDILQANLTKVQYLIGEQCPSPSVAINISKSSKEPYTMTILDKTRVQAVVNITCINAEQVIYHWEISRVDTVTGYFLPFRNIKRITSSAEPNRKEKYFNVDNSSFVIRPNSLQLGLYYIRLNVNVINQPHSWDSAFGFVQVIRAKPAVRILGPSVFVKYKETIELHAELFYPDANIQINDTGYIYNWFCRKEKGNNTVPTNSTPVATTYGNVGGTALGCFNLEPAESVGQGNTLIVDAAAGLQANQSYIIQLIVRRREKVSLVAVHGIFVVSGLQLSVRCVYNCGLDARKVTANKKLVFETACEGVGCEDIREFRWTLLVQEKHEWKEVDNLQEMTSSSLNNPTLVLSGNPPLLLSINYKLIVNLYMRDKTTEKRELLFRTNSPPGGLNSTGKNCFVFPQEGQAVIDDFSFRCEGYSDEDSPLNYQFSLSSPVGLVLYQTGLSPNATVRLPLGDSRNNYSLTINIIITDSYGAGVQTAVDVKVGPLKVKDLQGTLLGVVSGANSQLGYLLKKGKVEKVAQMSYAALSVVEESVNLPKQRKELKDAIVEQIALTNMTRLVQVSQVSAVMVVATKKEKELSLLSQENAVGVLEKAVLLLSSEVNNSETQNIVNIGKGLIRGTSNVVRATSTETETKISHKSTERNRGAYEDQLKRQKMTRKSLKLVDEVSNSLLTTKFTGEEPTVFKTDTLSVTLERQLLDNLGHKTIKADGSEIALPSVSDLFSKNLILNKTGGISIDLQIISLKKNPFNWVTSSSAVKSSVIDFSIKDNKGKPIEIFDIPSPIELNLPIAGKNTRNKVRRKFFIKPSVEFENMQYHKIDITSSEATVILHIEPTKNTSLEIYVGHNVRPNPKQRKGFFNTTIPNHHSCLRKTSNRGVSLNCTSSPYVVVLTSRITGGTGKHFVGIRYKQIQTSNSTMSALNVSARTRRDDVSVDCKGQSGRMKRSCVSIKAPPTTPPPTSKRVNPTYNATADANYTFTSSVASCVYWDEKKEKWSSEGCEVGMNSSTETIQCFCTHLSSFGGDFFVASNPIDFDKVFLEFGRISDTGNVVVLSTVCTIWMLYFLSLILARKADNNDRKKGYVCVKITEVSPEDHRYEVEIRTGIWKNYGTTANVGLVIYGEEGSTSPITLPNSISEMKFFSRGSINSFKITTPKSLGTLLGIRVWHDNSGKNPSWFLQMITVTDVETGNQYHFLANQWLAVEKGNGNIQAEIIASTEKDLATLRNLIWTRSVQGFSDKHLWLSIFTRPPHNSFTRCQRISCCLSILFATMLTNAMFYDIRMDALMDETFYLGPLKLGWRQIKIGIQSSLVAIPVNVLVVAIFRNTKPTNGKSEKTQGCLPYWFSYVGWFICVLVAMTSSFFIVFYSMMWGTQTSNEWLTSISVSLFQDILVSQPVKVIISAFLLSLIFKKIPKLGLVKEEKKGLEKAIEVEKQATVPKKEDLEISRQFRTKKLAMFIALKDISLLILFVALLFFVTFGNRNEERYLLTSAMNKTFSNVEKVCDTPTFWRWVRSTLIPGLYQVDWYNGQRFEYDEGFISNRFGFLVGMPRLRQLRVKPEPGCVNKNLPFPEMTFKRCIPFYSPNREDTTLYNKPGWIKANTTTNISVHDLNTLCPIPWRYQSSKMLQGLPYWGYIRTYDGGGYVGDLGYNQETAVNIVTQLEKDNWIDYRTAAVFVEFTVFDASSSLFASVKYLFEKSPTGGWYPYTKIEILTAYQLHPFYEIIRLFFKLIIAILFVAELIKIYFQGIRKYGKDFWNWIELINIALASAFLVCSFVKESFASEFVKRVQENPFKSSSIDYLGLWYDIENCILSLISFMTTLKCLRLFRFNRQVYFLMGTLRRSSKPFLSYFTIFFVFVFSYAQLGWMIFGSYVAEYYTVLNSLESLLKMAISDGTHFVELQSVNQYLAPIFILSYILVMLVILINIFFVILIELYKKETDIDVEKHPDLILAKFMKNYFNCYIKKYERGLKRLICNVKRERVQEGLVRNMENRGHALVPTDNFKLRDMESKKAFDRTNNAVGLEEIFEVAKTNPSTNFRYKINSFSLNSSFLRDIKEDLLDAISFHNTEEETSV